MKKLCVAVVGAPRSGTSAVAGLLHHLGVDMGRRLMEANVHNPKGFYEDMDFITLHAIACRGVEDPWVEPVWPSGTVEQYVHLVRTRTAETREAWGVKDPRLCMTLPQLATAVRDAGAELKVVVTVRSPHHSVHSLMKLHGGMSAQRAAELLGRYTYARSLNTERWLAQRPENLAHLFQLVYDDLVDHPQLQAERLCKFLGLPPERVTADAMAWVEPTLRHHTAAF